jgi:transcriptional regulator with XRE-family HTH domain
MPCQAGCYGFMTINNERESLMPRVAKRVDEHVGERVRQRRTELGLTQEHLAASLQISYQQVQKYETGANRISAGRLYEIADTLQMPVAYFFEGLEPKSERQPMEHGGRGRSAIELVRNFTEIDSPTVRSAIAGLVRTLAEGKAA